MRETKQEAGSGAETETGVGEGNGQTEAIPDRGTVRRAYLSILTGAALWGLIGLWNRHLMADGLTPTDIVVVRNFGGMCLLALVFAMRDRSVFRVRREHIKYFFGTGVLSVLLFTICYFSCQKICSLAVASVLLYTAPSFVVLLSAALWREPVTGKKLLALFLTLIGCAMVCGLFDALAASLTGGAAEGLTVTAAGVLLGLGAGFFYALYSIFGRYALSHYPPMQVTVWTFLIAGPASLFFLRPARLLSALSHPGTALYALGLVVFSTVLPYLFYTAGLAKVEAGKASIVASLEPVVASLAGVLLFQEPMSAFTALGILCVLSGVYILR